LSYDRLGVGQSELADPYLDVQAATQVAILAKVSELLQEGRLYSKIPIPKKLVHIGHSFGSLITNSLAATFPSLSDGMILTGFGHDFSWASYFQLCYGFEVARVNKPLRFRKYDSGYLTWGNEFDNQCAAFNYPNFDWDVLRKAELNKAPFTIAELLSFGVTPLAAPEYASPVLVRGTYNNSLVVSTSTKKSGLTVLDHKWRTRSFILRWQLLWCARRGGLSFYSCLPEGQAPY
jgi:pimeloyl-ACP methyl ester carboxylesterase